MNFQIQFFLLTICKKNGTYYWIKGKENPQIEGLSFKYPHF